MNEAHNLQRAGGLRSPGAAYAPTLTGADDS
jgi:hypothetical protein